MFDLKHAEEALANGPWGGPQVTLATSGGPRVYAYTRTRGTNTVLVAVNFGDAPVSAQYQRLAQPGIYNDWFAQKPELLEASGTLDIPAHGWRVLVK